MKKNPLSNQPGGSTLRFEFRNGTTQYQHNVKYPKKYADTVLSKTNNSLTKIVDDTNRVVLYENE